MNFCALSLVLIVNGAAPVAVQVGESKATRLTVRAAAAPRPALKYLFLPELRDMTPGNAALLYQRAHSPEWSSNLQKWIQDERVYDWLELPLKEFPKHKVTHLRHVPMLREVDRAARREQCDWEMSERVRQEGFALLIPDVQMFREYGMLLSLRARAEILDKEYDKAAYTLQTGFALGRHVSEAPLLINHLVGNAIVSNMLDRIEEWIQSEGAPNTYWALTALPAPVTDMRRALQGERLALEAIVPEIRTLDKTPLTPDAQRRLSAVLTSFEVYAPGSQVRPSVQRQLATLGTALSAYPRAKRALIAQGRKADEVAALPVVQVILIHSLQQYEHFQDELYKWVHLPYWQALPGFRKVLDEMNEARREGGSPFLELLPAVQNVREAAVRIERRIASLRCIEAIRLHAAAHDGKLPASLSDITVAPVPSDPATGKAFLYEVRGNRVTLRDPLLENQRPALPTRLHYEITFTR